MWKSLVSALGRSLHFARTSRVMLSFCLVGVCVAAFFLGRKVGLRPASAQPPRPFQPSAVMPTAPNYDDYPKRVVAYIHNSIPITRVDLAEYLIARFGAERLEFLVNRRIVEHAGQKQGIFVTDVEVLAQLQEDLKNLGGVSEKDFANQILKRFNKTMYEWKEDVVRPKLLIAKLVRPTVTVTDEDLFKGFEGRYGPKVQCRMICFPSVNGVGGASDAWVKLQSAPRPADLFREMAKTQYIHTLASMAGEIPPIHKHFGDQKIEREAFSLAEGKCSQVLGMPDGTAVILMCERHLPADTSKQFASEKANLYREIFDMKLAQAIPVYFAKLRQEAEPRLLLDQSKTYQSDLERNAMREIGVIDQAGFKAMPAPPK